MLRPAFTAFVVLVCGLSVAGLLLACGAYVLFCPCCGLPTSCAPPPRVLAHDDEPEQGWGNKPAPAPARPPDLLVPRAAARESTGGQPRTFQGHAHSNTVVCLGLRVVYNTVYVRTSHPVSRGERRREVHLPATAELLQVKATHLEQAAAAAHGRAEVVVISHS